MNSPREKKPQSPTVAICAFLFLVVGIALFESLAPGLFRRQGDGIDANRALWAGVVGAISAVIGASIGKMIDALRGLSDCQAAPPINEIKPFGAQSATLENVGRDFLASTRAALSDDGFLISENLRFRKYEFALIAGKIRFDFVAMPIYLEEFFLFYRCDAPDLNTITELCSAGWTYATAHRHQRPWLSWLLGVNVCSNTIVVCPVVHASVAEAIRTGTPPNHFREGFEVPLAYDVSTQKLHYFEKVPWLGGAFYTEIRKVIKKRLETHCKAI